MRVQWKRVGYEDEVALQLGYLSHDGSDRLGLTNGRACRREDRGARVVSPTNWERHCDRDGEDMILGQAVDDHRSWRRSQRGTSETGKEFRAAAADLSDWPRCSMTEAQVLVECVHCGQILLSVAKITNLRPERIAWMCESQDQETGDAMLQLYDR